MNKGFTLIELLAVIVVLGVLTLITVVLINPVLKDSRRELSDIQIDNIKESASLYYVKYGVGLDDFEIANPKDCINVSELIDAGYIDKDEITNPKTGEEVLGSVKITYNANNYIYEYQDNVCTNYDKGIICERVKSTDIGNVPEGKFIAGDAYNCKVDPNKDPYKFYVLTTTDEDSDMVNLIMDRNINSDGTPATKAIPKSNPENGVYNLMEWISKDDYLKPEIGGTEEEWNIECDDCGNWNKGPITAMDFLEEATKNWTNLKKITINTFTDDLKNMYKMKQYNIYARLAYYDEISIQHMNNKYLYEYTKCHDFISEGVCSHRKNYIMDIEGYWLLSSAYYNQATAYSTISGDHPFDVLYINDVNNFGVRPVISVYKFQME